MRGEKLADATWRGDSQRQAAVIRCEDWVLDKAFT